MTNRIKPSVSAEAWIFCRDERLARLWALALMDRHIDVVHMTDARQNQSPSDRAVCLWLVDLDDLTANLPLMTRLSLPTPLPCIAWSHRDPPDASALTDEAIPAVTFSRRVLLHRPFALDAMEQAVRDCLSDTPPLPDIPPAPPPAAVEPPAPPPPRAVDPYAIRLEPHQKAGTVSVGNDCIPLTAGEWAVLLCLWERRGQTVSRDQLRACLPPTEGNTVDVHICHLRRKIEKPLSLRLITAVRGVGYRWER